MDGVDVVLVDFRYHSTQLVACYSHPIPAPLKDNLKEFIRPDWKGSLANIGSLHQKLGKLFAEAANILLRKYNLSAKQVAAIGNHGQTVWHQPSGEHPFSIQLGDANLIAELTGITTIADFRSRDIAAGGQGAPLVPAFHYKALADTYKNRVILNIGGIANISYLPALKSNYDVSGFDTGPGNGLLDAWVQRHNGTHYDKNGEWAGSGTLQPEVLELLLDDPYFKSPPPKSTGKEVFNLKWLKERAGKAISKYKAADIQSTLSELTAVTISESIPADCDEVYVCGGGIHNQDLMQRIKKHLPDISIHSTKELGIDPDWMEAIAFAWLAKQTLEGKPGNLPSATGARGPRVLGAIYLGR